jgi:acetyl-CoA acetyltransferase
VTIRGTTAIVGIGEIPTRRTHPGRSTMGLSAEAIKLALDDAHLRKEDINGLVTDLYPAGPAEYLGIKPRYATGVDMAGATGATCVLVAANAITLGYCDTVLVFIGQARESFGYAPEESGGSASMGSEFENLWGPAAGAGNGYGLIYQRHMYEFGTTERQLAHAAANQRFNALENPNSAFQGQPISVDDVLNSRYTNEPLKFLESVMPAAGAAALILTSAEKAKALPNKPAYILGAAVAATHGAIWQLDRMVTSPTVMSAPDALRMSGYRAADMQFAQFYD